MTTTKEDKLLDAIREILSSNQSQEQMVIDLAILVKRYQIETIEGLR